MSIISSLELTRMCTKSTMIAQTKHWERGCSVVDQRVWKANNAGLQLPTWACICLWCPQNTQHGATSYFQFFTTLRVSNESIVLVWELLPKFVHGNLFQTSVCWDAAIRHNNVTSAQGGYLMWGIQPVWSLRVTAIPRNRLVASIWPTLAPP